MKESQIKNMFYCKKKICKFKCGPKSEILSRESLSIKRFIKKSNISGSKVTCNISKTELNVSRKVINNWLLKKDYKCSSAQQKT